MSLRRAALAALLVCAACGRQGPAASAQTAGEQTAGEQAAGDSWTLGTIESLGEGAAYVVIVDVARWPALRRHLAALTTPLTGADGLLGADASVPWLALAGDTLGPWLSAALAAADVTRTDAAPAEPIAGMDPTRPVVLALAEAPDDAPSRSFAAGLPLITGELSGLRHELVVPAADVALLRRSLAALLDQLGASRPELVAGHSDASGWQIGDVSVAMLAGDDQVRVIAVTHALRVEATSSTLPGLLRGPTPPPLRTAGVIAAARDDAPLSVLVRARRRGWPCGRSPARASSARTAACPRARATAPRSPARSAVRPCSATAAANSRTGPSGSWPTSAPSACDWWRASATRVSRCSPRGPPPPARCASRRATTCSRTPGCASHPTRC